MAKTQIGSGKTQAEETEAKMSGFGPRRGPAKMHTRNENHLRVHQIWCKNQNAHKKIGNEKHIFIDIERSTYNHGGHRPPSII
jgi:hypothetical protein